MIGLACTNAGRWVEAVILLFADDLVSRES
jgi:hypothetical protein